MSYEGYEQWLCENGHYFNFDCYDRPRWETWRCPHCNAKAAWTNSVDETNCEPVGYRELKMITGPKCRKCKCDLAVEPAIYEVPK